MSIYLVIARYFAADGLYIHIVTIPSALPVALIYIAAMST